MSLPRRVRTLAVLLVLGGTVFLLFTVIGFGARAQGKLHTAAASDRNDRERFDLVGEGHPTGGLRLAVTHESFPGRRLLLTVPAAAGLSSTRFHVFENGAPVSGVVVTPEGGTEHPTYALEYLSHTPYGKHEVEASVIVDGIGVVDFDYNSPPGAAHRSGSFWISGFGMSTAGFGAGLVLALGLVVLLSASRRRTSLRLRVGEFTTSPAVLSDLPPSKRRPRAPLLERLLGQMAWWPKFKADAENAGFTQSPSEIVALGATGTVLVALLAGAAAGTVAVTILVLPFGVLAVRSLVRHRLSKRRQTFSEQLAAHLEELASAMRAGHGLVSGLTAVARSATEPSHAEWTRVLTDDQLGMPLEEAMHGLAVRMASDDVEQVALVASLHHRTGGNMAEVLDRVSEGVRERADLRRELRALTSQARLSRWVVTILPVALVGLIALIDSSYIRPLFHTTGGLIVLAIAAVLVVLGSLVMRMLTDIKV